jgi:hypothetical protein
MGTFQQLAHRLSRLKEPKTGVLPKFAYYANIKGLDIEKMA